MLWRTGYLCCVSCTVRQSGGLQSNASPPPPPLHPPALSGPPGLRQLPQWSVAVLRQLLHPQREGGWFVCSDCLSGCFLSCQFSLLTLTSLRCVTAGQTAVTSVTRGSCVSLALGLSVLTSSSVVTTNRSASHRYSHLSTPNTSYLTYSLHLTHLTLYTFFR